MKNSLLRAPAVLRARGRSHSGHYDDIKKGLFTHSVKIGPRAVGWPAAEVDTLNAARIAGKTDDEVRDLVAKLEAARKVQA
ncbi:MAG: AlpA family phage regulatory protein [Candidatus Accumulibacter phosphatis]|uniref:helix-turn-helix transcriptional regulator n=1 Tax=Candidatus Accumulibacter sp. ACC012 TaxID=2823332 RepID=UPI0025C6086C|nr:AlpA family phage regulatory protein [Candidatus Accumulibacter sp. ACC012]